MNTEIKFIEIRWRGSLHKPVHYIWVLKCHLVKVRANVWNRTANSHLPYTLLPFHTPFARSLCFSQRMLVTGHLMGHNLVKQQLTTLLRYGNMFMSKKNLFLTTLTLEYEQTEWNGQGTHSTHGESDKYVTNFCHQTWRKGDLDVDGRTMAPWEKGCEVGSVSSRLSSRHECLWTVQWNFHIPWKASQITVYSLIVYLMILSEVEKSKSKFFLFGLWTCYSK